MNRLRLLACASLLLLASPVLGCTMSYAGTTEEAPVPETATVTRANPPLQLVQSDELPAETEGDGGMLLENEQAHDRDGAPE